MQKAFRYSHLHYPKQSLGRLALCTLFCALIHLLAFQVEFKRHTLPSTSQKAPKLIELKLVEKEVLQKTLVKKEIQKEQELEPTPTVVEKPAPAPNSAPAPSQSISKVKTLPIKTTQLVSTKRAALQKKVIETKVTKTRSKKKRLSSSEAFKLLISKFSAPVYPKEALRRGLEGDVVLELVISKTGKLIHSKILKSSGSHYLDQSALKESLHWTFKKFKHPKQKIRALKKISFRL